MTRLPQFLRQIEKNFSIPKATVIIAGLTLCSRVLGLIRTRLFTSEFGAGETLDTYFTAFRIPDLLTNILILGTLSVAFLPILTKYLVTDNKKAHSLAQTVLTGACLAMALLAGLGFIFTGPLTHLVAPGFTGTQLAETILLTRIILFAQVIFAISSILTTLLNAYKRFLFAGLAPLLYNLGIITGLLVFYPKMGIAGLGLGVVLGSIAHLAIQIPEAIHAGFSWKWSLDFKHPGIGPMLKLYVPRLFALDLSQASLLLASIFGSLLAAGSISVFNLAFDLIAVPVGIFALSTAIAAFPALSESFAEKNPIRFWTTLSKSAVQILFFIIPISIGMLVLRAHIVRLLYGAGQFNWEDTRATFTVLGILTCSLFTQSLIPLFARSLFARHNTKLPVAIGLSSVLLLIFISYLTVPFFGVNAIAYAFTIASIFNCAVLFAVLGRTMRKELKIKNAEVEYAIQKNVLKTTGRVLIASIVMGIVTYTGLYLFAPLVNTHTGLGILLQSGLAALCGGGAFLYLSQMLGLEQAGSIIRTLRLESLFPKTQK